MKKLHLRILLVACVAALGGGAAWFFQGKPATPPLPAPAAQVAAPKLDLTAGLDGLLAQHRKIIVLLADTNPDTPGLNALNQVGQALFHESVAQRQQMEAALQQALAAQPDATLAALDAGLTYVEAAPGLFDADRLAFREVLASWKRLVGQVQTLVAIKLHKRIGEDLEALETIERNYEREIGAIFGRFESRAIEIKRERWSDYLAKLKQVYNRDTILRDYGVITLDEVAASKGDELNGSELPPGTVLLTFDDGPHSSYTEEIQGILKKYGAQAVFFQVGNNLGKLDAAGKPSLLAARAEIDHRLVAAGHTLANHSFSHQKLSAQTGGGLRAEIEQADTLLKAVSTERSELFRFPYGAASAEGRESEGATRAEIEAIRKAA